MTEVEQELARWIEWYRNRPIRDPLMIEFLNAAESALLLIAELKKELE